MAKPKKPAPAEEHENAERWLLTYADMITLLVAFFIMMYSMSVVNLKKFQDLAIAIRSGFGGDQSGNKGTYWATKSVSAFGEERLPQLAKPSDETIHGRGKKDQPQRLRPSPSVFQYVANQLAVLRLDESIQPVLDLESTEGNRFIVTLTDQIIYEPGQTAITAANSNKLAHIGGILKDAAFTISVAGYSSSTPLDSPYKDSWSLSSERARQVIEFLVNQAKINPRRLSLTSYGEWKDPGNSKRLAMTGKGEWIPLRPEATLDDIKDRVVISVLIK